ncbi:MAG TPA: glycine zipper domain-containing protein [Tepidisphaeraceae bacterium]
MKPIRAIRRATLPLLLTAAALFGCESKAGNGALLGAAGGALVGGIIGNNTGSGHTGTGMLIGAGVGAVGGGLIGNSMDENDRREEERRYTTDYDRNFDRYGNRR